MSSGGDITKPATQAGIPSTKANNPAALTLPTARAPGSLQFSGRMKPERTDFEEVHVVIRQKHSGLSGNVEDTLPLKQFKGGNKAATF